MFSSVTKVHRRLHHKMNGLILHCTWMNSSPATTGPSTRLGIFCSAKAPGPCSHRRPGQQLQRRGLKSPSRSPTWTHPSTAIQFKGCKVRGRGRAACGKRAKEETQRQGGVPALVVNARPFLQGIGNQLLQWCKLLNNAQHLLLSVFEA